MRLDLTEDEEAIRDAFAGFFTNECPIETVRRAEPLGFDSALWAGLVQIGAPGMLVDPALGGGGASLADVGLVAEQVGRRLAPTPLIEHIVATSLLATVAPDHPQLGACVAGEQIATLALRPPNDGVARLCPAGAIADVVVAFDDDELVVASSTPPGVAPRNTADLPLADRLLTDNRTVIATGDLAHERFANALAQWHALTACTAVGLGRQALQLGVDYAMQRTQFDVPIGSFQAVQHGFANASVTLEGAALLAHRARWRLAADGDHELAAMAYLFCTETAQTCAATSLQYHGGYGYAEEYDIQLYYRRAKGLSLIAGAPGALYQTLADQLLPDGGAA